jgi:hypothetical protein
VPAHGRSAQPPRVAAHRREGRRHVINRISRSDPGINSRFRIFPTPRRPWAHGRHFATK